MDDPAAEYFAVATEFVDSIYSYVSERGTPEIEHFTKEQVTELKRLLTESMISFRQFYSLLHGSEATKDQQKTLVKIDDKNVTAHSVTLPDKTKTFLREEQPSLGQNLVTTLSLKCSSMPKYRRNYETLDQYEMKTTTFDENYWLSNNQRLSHIAEDTINPVTAPDPLNIELITRYLDTPRNNENAHTDQNETKLLTLDVLFNPTVSIIFSPKEIASILALQELVRHLTTFDRKQIDNLYTRLAESLRERQITTARAEALSRLVDSLYELEITLRNDIRKYNKQNRSVDSLKRQLDNITLQKIAVARALSAAARREDNSYVDFLIQQYTTKEQIFLHYLANILRNKMSGKRLLGRLSDKDKEIFFSSTGFLSTESLNQYIKKRDQLIHDIYVLHDW